MTTLELINAPLDELARRTPAPPDHSINVAKATALLDYLETRPEEHEQAEWGKALRAVDPKSLDQAKALALGACDTVGCAAGWTAALDGHIVGTTGALQGVILDLLPENAVEWVPPTTLDHGYTIPGELQLTEDYRDIPDDSDSPYHVYGYARDALGMTDEQADRLFYATSISREEIRMLFSRWTNGEIPAVRPETEASA